MSLMPACQKLYDMTHGELFSDIRAIFIPQYSAIIKKHLRGDVIRTSKRPYKIT